MVGVVNNVNDSANSNNIIFTTKDTKLFMPVVTLSKTRIKKYQKFLEKDLKKQCIGMNIK